MNRSRFVLIAATVACFIAAVSPGADEFIKPATSSQVTADTVHSAAYEASHVLKARPGTLVVVTGYNSKGTAQFIQLHDSATVPSDTAVPVLTMTVPTVANFTVTIPTTGMQFTKGIVVCNSSTGPTKTIGSADCWFTAVVK